MIFYSEPLNKILTRAHLLENIGDVSDWDISLLNEIGIYPYLSLPQSSAEYNRFIERIDVNETKYVIDSADSTFAIKVDEWRNALLSPSYEGEPVSLDNYLIGTHLYVAEYTTTPLSGQDLTDATEEARKVVLDEVESRLSEVSAWANLRFGSAQISDYKDDLVNILSDSNYPGVLAGEVEIGSYTNWPTRPVISIDSAPVTSQLVQLHASWDGSAAGGYSWDSNQLSSFGVDSVSRVQEGSFRVHFTTPFTDSNYTVTTGVGAERYSGAGASPRQLTVIRSEMTPNYVTVHCERTDDAVDEDNEYMSVIVMGTQ